MRIALFGVGMTHWGRLNPRCLFEDRPSPAGSELAMLGIGLELARLGHNVKVFCDCEPGLYSGVEYYRPEMALPILTAQDFDVLVSWQDASVFMYPVKAKLKVLMCQGAHLGLGAAQDKVDRYFAISRFSAKTLLDSDPYADPTKMWVTRNGVFLDRYPQDENWHNPKRLVWASSPDRGLTHLVDIFKLVQAEVPDASLTICYDFDRAYKSYHEMFPGSAFTRHLDHAAELKRLPGVEMLQHVSQPKLARLFLEAGMLVYPCDPIRATETYCTTVNDAMAAGLPVFISDADCLPENYGSAAIVLDRPIDHEAWARRIIDLIQNPLAYETYTHESLSLAAQTDVSSIAKDWETFFHEFLGGCETTSDRSLAARLGK